MSKYENVLRWSLFVGAFYFLGVSVTHIIGYKIPAFFIYFDIRSNDYQDKIISILAIGWSVYLFIAGRQPSKHSTWLTGIVFSGAAAVGGLCVINLITDFETLAPTTNLAIFWGEKGLLLCYLLLLVFFRTLLLREGKKT